MSVPQVVVVAVLIVVWAIFASNRMAHAANEKKLAVAKQASFKLGGARWGVTDKLKGEGGIRIGFDKSGDILRFTKPRCHGLVVGKTGVGKGVWAISAILDMVGRASIVLVDMKGNTTAVCKRHMATSGTVTVCNPFERDKGPAPSARYNWRQPPFSVRPPTPPRAHTRADIGGVQTNAQNDHLSGMPPPFKRNVCGDRHASTVAECPPQTSQMEPSHPHQIPNNLLAHTLRPSPASKAGFGPYVAAGEQADAQI